MHDGATAKVREFEVHTNGAAIHLSVDPNIIEPGTILSPVGDVITTVKPTLMNRIDSKGAEKITLSKGTLWFVGVAFVLLQVVFSYGGSLLGWARDDQSQKEQIIQIKAAMQAMVESQTRTEGKIEAFGDRLRVQEIQNGKGEGYKLGVLDGDAGHATKKK